VRKDYCNWGNDCFNCKYVTMSAYEVPCLECGADVSKWEPASKIPKIKAKLMSTTDPQFLPSRKYPKDGGADLRARIDQPQRVYPHVMYKIPVGCAVEIPEGYVGLIQPRSGASTEGKLAITGVIDSAYRGEMCVNVFYLLDEGYITIQPFERIAQLVVVPVYIAEFVLVNELSESDRGSKGFGSSGRM